MYDDLLSALSTMTQEARICACLRGLEICAQQVEQLNDEIEQARGRWLSQLTRTMGITESAVQELLGTGMLIERAGGNLESAEVELSLEDVTQFLLKNRKHMQAMALHASHTKTQLDSLLGSLKRELNGLISRRSKAYAMCNALTYQLYDIDDKTAEAIKRELAVARTLARRSTTEVAQNILGE